MIETLTCAFDGHKWDRERKKGKKPAFCDEHRSEGLKIAPDGTIRTRGSDEALDILTSGVFVDPEFEAKLMYVVNILDNPTELRRRAEDIPFLEDVQRSLVREFKRSWPNAAREVGIAA